MENLKNKISINVKYYKKNHIKRIAGHNSRKHDVSYLLPEEDRLGPNVDIFYRNGGIVQTDTMGAEEKDKMFNDIFEKLEAKKNSIQKAKKSYSKKTENLLLEGVFAFPEALTKEYLKDKDINIQDGLHRFTQHIKKQYGFEPVQISLHLDEGYRDEESGEVKHNIHAHLTFFNMDFEKGVMPLWRMKKSDWSRWQDIAAKSMQEAGLDFERGDSKDITNRRHLGRNDFIQANEIVKKELSDAQKQVETWEFMRDELIAECSAKEKELNNIIQEQGKEIKETNRIKNENKELLKTLEKGTQEHNDLFAKIGVMQQQEQEMRAEQREVKKELDETKKLKEKFKAIEDKEEFRKTINKTINNFLNNNVVVSKSLLGKETYEIEDYDNFVKKLKVIAFNINRVEFGEIDGLKKTIAEKDKEIEALKSAAVTDKMEFKKELEQKNKKIKNLTHRLDSSVVAAEAINRVYGDLVDNLKNLTGEELIEYTKRLKKQVIEEKDDLEILNDFEDFRR